MSYHVICEMCDTVEYHKLVVTSRPDHLTYIALVHTVKFQQLLMYNLHDTTPLKSTVS